MFSDEQKRARYDAMRPATRRCPLRLRPHGGGYAGNSGGNLPLRAAFLLAVPGASSVAARLPTIPRTAPMWSISNWTLARPRTVPARPSAIRASIPVVTAAAWALSPEHAHTSPELRWPRAHRRRLASCLRARSSRSAPECGGSVARSGRPPAPDCGGSGRTA